MNCRDTFVVLDTCVLLKLRLTDVLMDLRAEKLFSAHWTQEIDHEFLRNMEKVYGIARAKALSRLNAMKARCPEWEIVLSKADFDAVPQQVDAKDRHVAAAALALRHAIDQDESSVGERIEQVERVLLITENIKDFAVRPMKALGVRVVRPGPFLDEACNAEPEATARAVQRSAAELKNPPRTLTEVLEVLSGAGAKALVTKISTMFGLQVRANPRPRR